MPQGFQQVKDLKKSSSLLKLIMHQLYIKGQQFSKAKNPLTGSGSAPNTKKVCNISSKLKLKVQL